MFSDAFVGLVCTDCGASLAADDAEPAAIAGAGPCPDCGAPRRPEYDLDGVDPDAVRAGPRAWDRDTVLPFEADSALSAAEGGTPSVDAPRLADELGLGGVAIKDEARNPTGSVLDRGLAVAVTAADASGAELVACASPGNAGQSMAAYAGQVDLRSYAFVPTRSPFSNKAMVNVHGGEMKVVPGRLGDAVNALTEELQSDYVDLGAFASPFRHDGLKTVAYELLADRDWDAPDAVVLPAGTGELVVGVVDGLRECVELGLIDDLPPVYAVQADGCAPIAAAWQAGRDDTEPWETPDTIVGELEVADPPGGPLALAAIRETGGEALTVEDPDALESAVAVASTETVEVGLAGGVAAAGLWALAEDGTLGSEDEAVVLNTEAATKAPDVLRSHLMGQGV
ncbi:MULTISPECIES: pyridoxal-phosphate dependent enzyme [Halolamina]|uniref:Threonine synthase n=1 Tax=Halolamina pelagica TaxID=699431 RepID=A0A1I5R5N6_9EURY|nr:MULTISPECIES: pyridoxal-phosphate dependent enzyme [Halolamina]NHX35700.1 pyridoxal-phosphate dependent enzyme [Halolamina sp. R1-12]SFP53813.1 threonine synthase [Halolamina pelagica]